MTLDVTIQREAHDDIGRLPSSALINEAYTLIVGLKTNPMAGKQLGAHAAVGDLTGYRKMYFDGTRHRIIYGLEPDETNPKLARVIAVGKRANLEVYHDAARRLGRTPGIDAPLA